MNTRLERTEIDSVLTGARRGRLRSRGRIVVATTVLALVLAAPALAQWQVGPVDDEGSVGTAKSLDFAPPPPLGDGNPSVAYRDLTNAAVKYAHWDGSQWVRETVGPGGHDVSLAHDAEGVPAISHLQLAGSYRLIYTRRDGVTWDVVDGHADAGQTSLAHDATTGYPMIAYRKKSGPKNDVTLARWDGAQWNLETVAEGGEGRDTSLALDPNDLNPSIAYSHVDYSAGTSALRFAHWNGSAWHVEDVELDAQYGSDFASLAYDPTGNPAIVHAGHGTPGIPDGVRYHHAAWDEGASAWVWSTEWVGDGEGPTLAIDSLGTAYVGYFLVVRTPSGLDWEARLGERPAGGSWTTELVEGPAAIIRRVDVAVDPDDPAESPSVAFSVERSSPQRWELRYGRRQPCVSDTECDDGEPCNGFETCAPDGSCTPGTPVDCDDGDPCTADGCSAGTCTHDPDDCDDGDPCTVDTCDPLLGCQHELLPCGLADGCCPPGCDSGMDPDCTACGAHDDPCDSDDDCCSGNCRRRGTCA